jgi:VWFA-related protein
MRNLLPFFAVALCARASGDQEPPRFPSDVQQVVVDVVVLGADGRPATGLAATDFEIREDGQPQTLSSFTVVDVPPAGAAPAQPGPSENREADPSRPERLLAVVFDEQHLAPSEATAARKGVARFIEGLPPGDRLYLIATGSGRSWSARLPEGKTDLLALLEQMHGMRPAGTGPEWISDFEAQRIAVNRDKRVGAEVQRRFMENGIIADQQLPNIAGATDAHALVRETMGQGNPMVKARAAEVWAQAKDRRRSTLAALEFTLNGLSSRRGRKTVLLVTAGFIHDTDEPGFARVAEAARRANAVVYFVDARVVSDAGTSRADGGRAIDIRDLGTSLNRNVAEVTGAASVAVESGGERIGTAATLPETLGRLADEGRAYYLLGYVPADRKSAGGFRRIEVKVGRPGLKVRARPGYYAPVAEPAAAAEAKEALPPEIRRALDSPFGGGDVPLRMAAYVVGPGAEGRSRVVLVAEADPRALGLEAREGREVGGLDTYLSVRSRDGGTADAQEARSELAVPTEMRPRLDATWLPLRRARELGPGAYEARMAVRDRANGHVGSVVHNFEVPEAAAFRVSTPVLTDEVSAEDDAPSLIARRAFAPGSRIWLQFEVQGAALDPATGAPRVRVGHELRRNAVATASSPEPTLLQPGPDGRLSLRLAASPRMAGPAEFVIRVLDEVSGRTVESREAFQVDPSVPPAPQATPPRAAAAAPAPPPPPGSVPVPSVAPGLAGLRQLTALYREGKVGPAVISLARWEPRDRKEALRALARGAAEDPSLGIAAAVLATEVAFTRPGQEKTELEEARRLLDQVQDPARRDEVLRLWLVTAGQRYQYSTRFDEAERLFNECLKRQPADPRANLALGSIHELRAALGLLSRGPMGGTGVALGSESLLALQARSGRAKEAEGAEERYRKALADPLTAPEARLRLGRTLQLQGKNGAAAPELETAAQAPDPRLRALALLFLSRIEGGKDGAALERARAAHAALPGSQTVAIGFAHALARAGKRQEGADVVRAALAAPAPDTDAWLAYQLGGLDTSALDALRKGVRP